MPFLINVGRFAMLAWVVYALLLIFAPSFIHQLPNQTSGIIQLVVAFGAGNLLDRALGAVRRRRGEANLNPHHQPASSDTGDSAK